MVKYKPENTDWLFHIVMLALLLFGAWFRFWQLDAQSFWLDEFFQLDISRSLFPKLINKTLHDVHPPLFNIIAGIWIDFGANISMDKEIYLRILPVSFGVASLFVAAYGLKTLGRPARLLLVAMLIVAYIPFEQSRQFRSYGMLLFFSTCLYVLFVHFVVAGQTAKVKKSRLFLLFICGLSACFTHYFGAVLFFSGMIALWFITNSKTHKKAFVLVTSLVATLFLPWLFYHLSFIGHYTGHNFWIPADKLLFLETLRDFVFSQPANFTGGLPPLVVETVLGAAALVMGTFLVFASVCGIYFHKHFKNTETGRLLWFTAILLVLSVGVPTIISLHTPILTPRNLVIITVPFFTFFALLVVPPFKAFNHAALGRLSVAILLVAAYGYTAFQDYYLLRTPDLRKVFKFIDNTPDCDKSLFLMNNARYHHLMAGFFSSNNYTVVGTNNINTYLQDITKQACPVVFLSNPAQEGPVVLHECQRVLSKLQKPGPLIKHKFLRMNVYVKPQDNNQNLPMANCY